MKGLIFTEFIEMVEEKFGFDISDKVLEDQSLSTKGIFTASGTYPFTDLVAMLTTLNKETNISIEDLQNEFAKYIFAKISSMFPQFFESHDDVLKFIASVDEVIHVEVQKLYPDAELPSFDVISIDDNQLEMYYISEKNLVPFAKGMMEGASKYYNMPIDIEVKKEGEKTHFLIKKKS